MITDVTKWECDRCGKEEITDGELHVPEGWVRVHITAGPPDDLCIGCACALINWIGNERRKREVEA